MFNAHFFFFEKSCSLGDNVEKYDRPSQAAKDNIERGMRFACWITKATDTHSEYLIAFPRQQWFRESASMLRFTYAFCKFTAHSFNDIMDRMC